jgi:hypothetical protein
MGPPRPLPLPLGRPGPALAAVPEDAPSRGSEERSLWYTEATYLGERVPAIFVMSPAIYKE